MSGLRHSLIFFVLLGFVCVVNSNPILNLFGKGGDDKVEGDDKTTVTTSTTAKAAADTTTTTTASPESSCGGLKGFLHICEKSEPTEPPKNIKTRSVSEDDDSSDEDSDEDSKEEEEDDDDDDKDDGDDDDDEDDKKNNKEEETTQSVGDATEGKIEKRQAEETEAPSVDEVPVPPEEPSDYTALKKRQVDDDDESDSDEEGSRRRRDCRDGDGDYEKDCRRKRELVPCIEPKCINNETTPEN